VAQGRFITFEGGEGTGKSTQARRLAERLRALDLQVVQTREPGGSPGAETIRELLVRGEADRWSPVTEALLMYAARRDHIERTIRPALERGAWVVCDRFADSTRAYQGAAGKAPMALISALEDQVLEGLRPDLTLVMDYPAQAGLERAGARPDLDTRFEGKGLQFHLRLREAFLAIAAAEPERCAVVDASGPVEAVEARVWGLLQQRLGAAAA
jgi:dTMP kinase